MAFPSEKSYTIEDIYALPEGERAELIDGKMYIMEMPMTIHQKLVSVLSSTIDNYIETQNRDWEVYITRFAVFIDKDERNYVEPDISVICDKSKLDERGCNGAPDWIIEITSPSTAGHDYGLKLFKYRTAGVREYWIVNPEKQTVTVFDFETDEKSNQYSFDDTVPVCIYEDFSIRIADLLS